MRFLPPLSRRRLLPLVSYPDLWFTVLCSAKKREEKMKKQEEARRLKEEEKKNKVSDVFSIIDPFFVIHMNYHLTKLEAAYLFVTVGGSQWKATEGGCGRR